MLKCSILSIVPLIVILNNDLLLSPGPCLRRDPLWGSVSRSSHPLLVASCVPGRCDFHRPALIGDWVPGVKLGPFSLARARGGLRPLPRWANISWEPASGLVGMTLLVPGNQSGPVPRCLQRPSLSATIMGF